MKESKQAITIDFILHNILNENLWEFGYRHLSLLSYISASPVARG